MSSLFEEQDKICDDLDRIVEAQRRAALEIHGELQVHNELLSDTEHRVDAANSHTKAGIKQTKKIAQSESGCCTLL